MSKLAEWQLNIIRQLHGKRTQRPARRQRAMSRLALSLQILSDAEVQRLIALHRAEIVTTFEARVLLGVHGV